MKLDRNNRWFRGAIALMITSVVIGVLELYAIVGRNAIPPEWTNWFLMSMPIAAMLCVLQSLRERQHSDPEVRARLSEGV
jgi:hypothetical protein